MANLFSSGKFQATDSNGLAAPGAKLYTYAAGGLTPLATYTDQGGGSSNFNPVVCDAAGQANVWLGTSSYRMILKTAADVVIWDTDNIRDGYARLTNPGAESDAAGAIPVDLTLNYVAGTIGAFFIDLPVNVMWLLTEAERAQVKANTAAIDLTPKINAAKALGGNRPLYMPAGTWSFTSLDFKGNTGGIVGDGIGVTTLKCRSAVARALDFNDTTDVNPRAGILKGFTLEGDGVALGIGIDIRYRHQFRKEDIYVRGFTGAGGVGIKELDTYTCHERNVRTAANGTGRWLVGSNHASTHTGGGSDTNTVCNLLIQTNGTPADGNRSLVFTGFVTQSAAGTGTGCDITCSDVTFTGCYFGENNAASAAIICRGGIVNLNGGNLFFGFSATSYGITPIGGKVILSGVQINGQTFNGISNLIAGTTSGKVAFYDCVGNLVVSGDPVLDGDPLDYGPQGIVYAKRLGKSFSTYTLNTTVTTALASTNGRTITCATAPGPTPIFGLNTPLVGNADWRDGEPLSLVFVYSSTVPVQIWLSATAGGGAPSTMIGTAPSTGGVIKTYLKLDAVAASTAWTLIEQLRVTAAVNDTFTSYHCSLADSRTLNKGTAQFGNLYK